MSDGTSNIIAVGERKWQFKSQDGMLRTSAAAVAFGVTRANGDAWGRSDQIAIGAVKLNYTHNSTGRGRRGFSSNHPSGAQFLLADASTHYIPNSIEHDTGPDQFVISNNINSVWEYLLARRDNNPVDLP